MTSSTDGYPVAEHFMAFPNPVVNAAYGILSGCSYPVDDLLDSAARGILSPTKPEREQSAVDSWMGRAYWLGRTILNGCVAVPTVLCPIGRAVSDSFRPKMSFVVNLSHEKPEISTDSLHLMTSNMALGPGWLNAKAYFSPSPERAELMAEQLLSLSDNELPHVFLGQEVWDDRASEALVEALKTRYPYIIHSIGPNPLGRSSGLFFASRHPIKHAEFRRFDSFPSSDNLANKGILRAEIQVGDKLVAIHNLHNVAPENAEGAKLREHHLVQLLHWIQEDQDKFDASFVAGDFNISPLNNFGQRMEEYQKATEVFFRHFYDPFLKEHDELGKRVSGKSRYLGQDTRESAAEPEGSFYAVHNLDSWLRGGVNQGEVPGCRYDFILRYIKDKTSCEDTAEIRRIFGKYTDHLALSANCRL